MPQVAARTTPERLVVWYGQSMILFPAHHMPWYTARRHGDIAPYALAGVGDTGWDGLAAAGYKAKMLRAPIATVRNVLVCQGGQRDLMDLDDPADIYADIAAQADEARAGYDKIVMVTTTLLPGLEDACREYNELLIADSEGAFDAVVDLMADDRLVDNTDQTYFFGDFVHFRDAGAEVAGGLCWPTVRHQLLV